MDDFWNDLDTGEIHARDRWQFELKSDFSPVEGAQESAYTQEFYFFIPNSLQINDFTYSKDKFYEDLTNLIRYKTPQFSLKQIADPKKKNSPLNKLKSLSDLPFDEVRMQAEDELKLLGNVVRSSLREAIYKLIGKIRSHSNETYSEEIETLINELKAIRTSLHEIKSRFTQKELKETFQYLDEFLCNIYDYYLTGLLDNLRKYASDDLKSDQTLSIYVLEVDAYRASHFNAPVNPEHFETDDEDILYRNGLLKKFVLDALLLDTSRSSPHQNISHVIGALAAGIAMLIYVLLFVWQGTWFVLNSEPFIIITVLLYILKDRLKEGLRSLSFRHAARWFSDYTTEIIVPEGKTILGIMKESFSFVDENKLPEEITTARNREFHKVLEEYKRPEQILYYKKKITIRSFIEEHRRTALNILFRFNIQRFLSKASDPFHTYTNLNPETRKLDHHKLPKIYHINMIIRTSFEGSHQRHVVKFEKFRLVADKNGIKHIQKIHIKQKEAV